MGASAGGIEPLRQLAAELPADAAAAVLVTVHVATTTRGALPAMLERVTALPSAYASLVDGDPAALGQDPGQPAVALGSDMLQRHDRGREVRGQAAQHARQGVETPGRGYEGHHRR